MTEWNSGRWTRRLLLALTLISVGCGEREEKEGRKEEGSHEADEEQLTPFQLEHGIGPVKEAMVLTAIDPALVNAGKESFEIKCSGCHKMDTTYVGPSLGEVTTRRSPAYVMNMILNPQEMVEHHPVAKKLLAERMSFMPNQGLTVEQARAVLEYLRTQAKGSPKP